MKEQVKQPVKRVLINTVPNTFAFVSPTRLPFTTAQLPQDEFLISGSLEQVSPCTAPSQGTDVSCYSCWLTMLQELPYF